MSGEVVSRSKETTALFASCANRVSYLFKMFLRLLVKLKLLDTVEEAIARLAMFLWFLDFGFRFHNRNLN